MPAPDLINWIEVFFWPALGIACLACAIVKRGTDWFLWILAPTFVLFGASDYIELQTGAWWKPWWLLALKVGCIIVFLIAAVRWRRRAKPNEDK